MAIEIISLSISTIVWSDEMTNKVKPDQTDPCSGISVQI